MLATLLTVLLVAQLALVIWNVHLVRRPRARRWRTDAPTISVLVPARNEEQTIGECLGALLAQDYPNLEIVVLDDGSTDGTRAALAAIDDRRVRVMTGTPLPYGWTGKNWACHQLATAARGDVLCFVDADTLLEPETISRAAGEISDGKLGLVSMLLHSETGTVAEGVLMPCVNYALLAFLPAKLIERPGADDIAVALGPFIMVTREAYDAAGGHAGEPAHIVDDMRLARSVKAAGYPVALRNGSGLVSTRWYTGFREIWDGFSKNAYGGVGYRPSVVFGALFVIVPVLVFPFLALGAGVWTGGALALPAFQVSLILSTRTITSRAGKDPLWSVPFHPVMVSVWAGTLARSALLARSGREVEWKGRQYATRPPEGSAR